MKNPIIAELKKLKLISNSSIVTLKNKTRDKNIKVLKDTKSKIIFLDKFITGDKYYSSVKYDFKKSKKPRTIIENVKTIHGIIKTPMIQDDERRISQFKKILKNKDILDFGCGNGGFLRGLKNYKSLSGVELRKDCIDNIKRQKKKIHISNNINTFKNKFDVITIFHVLEHVPHQVETLRILKSKLKSKGKIIIEVPHANDFLILQDELDAFKNFAFWKEHLVLHTKESLKKIILKSGFKKVNIQYYQRYNFANHLGWLIKKKPGGHMFYNNIVSDQLNQSYAENLKKLCQTDTLIAIAE